ncbi:MAG: hypothetical protein M0P01_02605 [Treponema sp.]|nr:hypothetical protein [Treponema sp.]
MKVQAEVFINRFLRTYRNVFSDKDFSRMLVKMGIRVSHEECEEYLNTSSSIFALKSGLYVTRAGAFTNKYFSFKPSRKEFDQQFFAAGGRCMPFVDPEVLPSTLTFLYKGEVLQQMAAEFDSGTASDMFALYGEEFASQYIAADPVNADIDIAAHDFELPPKVKLTANSLAPLIKYSGFKFGDRLLCRVINWDLGQIEVMPVKRNENPMQMRSDDLERQNWYDALEKALISSFDLTGPGCSIEEQLAVVFLDNSSRLCTPECGSVEEFLMQSKKIAYESFGVETRLWLNGVDVPAVGKWNEIPEDSSAEDGEIRLLKDLAIPDYILDAYIQNQLFDKRYDPYEIISVILPDNIRITAEEHKFFLLHINSRHDILKKSYNWFADFTLGEIRKRALALYKEASTLIFEIDRSSTNLERYPQQELVILSQIFSHVMKILEMIVLDSEAAADDVDEILLSLEGMESNFYDINNELIYMVESERRNGFVVIK